MRLAGITPESVVDGPGIRFVIFAQGCPHACPRCHNPESWSPDGGKEFTVRQILRTIRKQKKKIRGVTFSGGEPFLQAEELSQVAQAVREMELDVVTYTGYTYEALCEMNDSGVNALLAVTDLLVDGTFKYEFRDIGLKFRGSTNQRLIDVAASQAQGEIVLWDKA